MLWELGLALRWQPQLKPAQELFQSWKSLEVKERVLPTSSQTTFNQWGTEMVNTCSSLLPFWRKSPVGHLNDAHEGAVEWKPVPQSFCVIVFAFPSSFPTLSLLLLVIILEINYLYLDKSCSQTPNQNEAYNKQWHIGFPWMLISAVDLLISLGLIPRNVNCWVKGHGFLKTVSN